MTITEIPARFRAPDGTEYATAAEALRHEQLTSALRIFESARQQLGQKLAEMALTADGQPFVPNRDYWQVAACYSGAPTVARVDSSLTWPSWTDFRVEDGEVLAVPQPGHNTERRVVRVSELYASEAAAIRACLVAHDEHLKDLHRERLSLVDRLRALEAT